MNGLRKCGIDIQWNFTQPQRRMKFCYSPSKWMELENIILSEVSQVQRPKIVCSPSYVDYRSKTNAVILLDMGHTLREECIQEK
jgi:hypothetical protein